MLLGGFAPCFKTSLSGGRICRGAEFFFFRRGLTVRAGGGADAGCMIRGA